MTYPEGCRANCAYCGLARHREAERNYADRNFIRVDWPAVPMEQIAQTIGKDPANSPFHRMCISMITHPKSDADTIAVLKTWTKYVSPDAMPISILSNPTTMGRDDVKNLKDLGERFSLLPLMPPPQKFLTVPVAKVSIARINGQNIGKLWKMHEMFMAKVNLVRT